MSQEKIENLKQKLLESRQQLQQAVDGMTEADGEIQVQAEGEQWTVLQMLRHLQDAERGLLGQAKKIVAGEPNLPPDFDIDRWNARTQRKTAEVAMTAEQALANLETSRQELVAFLDTIQEEDWSKTGWQASFKRDFPLEEFLGFIAEHEKTHAAEIAAALKK